MTKREDQREVTLDAQRAFLQSDLADALKWVFLGALTWVAAGPDGANDRIPHQRVVGLNTVLLQGRALYEFFYQEPRSRTDPLRFGDSAWAGDFVENWQPPGSDLYAEYMGNQTPVQKRAAHLVYGRTEYHGGDKDDETTHISSQVMAFAKDLHRVAVDFARRVRPEYAEAAMKALNSARAEGDRIAAYWTGRNCDVGGWLLRSLQAAERDVLPS